MFFHAAADRKGAENGVKMFSRANKQGSVENGHLGQNGHSKPHDRHEPEQKSVAVVRSAHNKLKRNIGKHQERLDAAADVGPDMDQEAANGGSLWIRSNPILIKNIK